MIAETSLGELFKRQGAANYLKISKSKLDGLRRDGLIQHIKIGRGVVYSLTELQRFALSNQRVDRGQELSPEEKAKRQQQKNRKAKGVKNNG